MSSKGIENEPNKVQVITAGGVGRRKPRIAQQAEIVTPPPHLELEEHHEEDEEAVEEPAVVHSAEIHPYKDDPMAQAVATDPLPSHPSMQQRSSTSSELVWLVACFLGIMASFVCYGLLLEYTTSGGRQLHELSFLFVTSGTILCAVR